MNQGATYRQERDGGYLWAPKETKGGRVLGHHADLLRVREGTWSSTTQTARCGR